MNKESIYLICGATTIITILFCTLIYYYQNNLYKKSDYSKHSNLSFFKILFNKGARGEYRTSNELQKATFYKKTIYNCYVENKKGESTEIDIIMLSEKGIFVVENKNYQGWIFGDEKSKNWCQTIKGKKSFFYNPIKQNKSHINGLDRILQQNEENYISLITFNSDATLKKIKTESSNVFVMNTNQLRYFLRKQVKKEIIYTAEQVNNFYKVLLPYTQMSEEYKQMHIERIKNKYK